MYGKILIKSKMTVLTGMHIVVSVFSYQCGNGVVVRDALTGGPCFQLRCQGRMRPCWPKRLRDFYHPGYCQELIELNVVWSGGDTSQNETKGHGF